MATDSSAGKAQWETAWHGCKIEALFSIMYNGFLAPSCDPGQGHRCLTDAPGIYVHQDGTFGARFTILCAPQMGTLVTSTIQWFRLVSYTV